MYWIDDTLLSLLLAHNPEGPIDISWAEELFRRSLAAIQAANTINISSTEVTDFLSARISGIVHKVGDNRNKWASIVQSGIPLNSDLILEENLTNLIDIVQFNMLFGTSIDTKITILKEMEVILKKLPVLTEKGDYFGLEQMDAIRESWLKATPIANILALEGGQDVITQLYTFSLPWVLNGISKKMRQLDLEEEADLVEELAILVEAGLPTIEKVKIYQTGIRSRTAANELGDIIDPDFRGQSIADYKRELLNNTHKYDWLVSETTAEWLQLLSRYARGKVIRINPVPDFTLPPIHRETSILIAKNIGGQQYLISPDLQRFYKIDDGVSFSQVNNLPGVEFVYSRKDKVWRMKINNPYIQLLK